MYTIKTICKYIFSGCTKIIELKNEQINVLEKYQKKSNITNTYLYRLKDNIVIKYKKNNTEFKLTSPYGKNDELPIIRTEISRQ